MGEKKDRGGAINEFRPAGVEGVVRKRNSAAYEPGVSRRKEQLCFWRRITKAKETIN